LVRKYAGLLETDSTSLEKYKELQLFPKDLKNFKGQNIQLFYFGIEGFRFQ